MAAGEGAVVGLDVEGFEEVDVFARDQLQQVGDETRADVGLGNQHRTVVIEPRMVEPGAQAHQLEHGPVDVVEDHHVDVRPLGHLLQADRGAHRGFELVARHVVHHLVARGQLAAVRLQLLVAHGVDHLAVGRIGQEADFGPQLGEQVVRVDVGGPHGLVVVGQQPQVRLAEDGAGAGRRSEEADLPGDLLARTHHDLHVPASRAGHRPGGFERSDERSGAEVVDEVVLVQRVPKRNVVLGDVDEEDRHLGHVAQEAYPREVLGPRKELGDDEIDLLHVEAVHSLHGLLLVVDDPGEHNVEEFHRRKYLFHIGVLAFGIRAPPEPFAQRLETGRRDQQQTCFRFSGFLVTIHV